MSEVMTTGKEKKIKEIQKMIQDLFNKHVGNAIIDFTGFAKKEKTTGIWYIYPIFAGDYPDYAEVKRMFKKYGTIDNVYTANILSSKSGKDYLCVRYNKSAFKQRK